MAQQQRVLSSDTYSTIKRQQYPEKVLLSDTVPAGEQRRQKVDISHIGDFVCFYITGSYTTLYSTGEYNVDNGVCSLRGQLIDGTGMRKLFNDFIPLDLWLSPGRIKTNVAANVLSDEGAILRADPAQQLFYPFEFQHLFDVNSTIVMDCKNDSTSANTYSLCFHGIRLLRGK